MKIFLIILAVIVVIIAAVLSLSATFTVVYDKKWSTKIKVLWIERDIELTKILSFVLFPQKKAQEVNHKKSDSKDKPPAETAEPKSEKQESTPENTEKKADNQAENKNYEGSKPPQEKPNYLKSLWDKEGIVGIMLFISNLLQTASSAVRTLIKGFHIYSLYVKIIVGTGDSAHTAIQYGNICKYYYPIKGTVLNGMRVDNYDDLITADFLALSSEYGFQLVGSISVGALVKVLLCAGKTFLVNLIKNK